MSGEHERFVEELAAYVLDSVEGPERARIEAHIASCATCGGLLREYQAVVGVLPVSLEPVVPPAGAWAAIRNAARGRPLHMGFFARMAEFVNWRPVAGWSVVGAVVASLLIWNVVLQLEVPGKSEGPQVEALARRPGRLVILAGAGVPAASARLLVAADGGHGHLAIAGLKRLPADRIYQIWFVRAGAPTVTGGTFNVDARGRAWVSVDTPVPFDEVREIAVTEEAAPRSVTPTGPYLLVARSWR